MTPAEHIAWIRDYRNASGVVTTALEERSLALCDAYEALAAAARELANEIESDEDGNRAQRLAYALRALLGEAS